MTGRGEFVTLHHLGGFHVGGDPDTYYPNLWEWLIEALAIETVLDVGCGDGATVDWFTKRLGPWSVSGIDGYPSLHPQIKQCDFRVQTVGGYKVDLVWSCEFVEHVEEEFAHNYLAAFCQGRYLVMTHALPGQPGHHHVNCQNQDYWVNTLRLVGFELDGHLTAQARAVASTDQAETNYFAKTGLVFERGAA